MQAIGFGLVYLAYGVWYTLYQKTWGDGSGLLYNLTGSSRFKTKAGAPPPPAQSATNQGGYTGLGKGGGGDQTGAPQGLGK